MRICIFTIISLISLNALADEPQELHFNKPAYNSNPKIEKPNTTNQNTKAINQVPVSNIQKKTEAKEEIKALPILPAEISVANFDDEVVNIDTMDLNNKFSTNTSSLWSRIRNGFKMPNLVSDLAEDRTRWYAERPEYFLRINERATKYLYHIVQELEKRNMPLELALLPIIESAFNPTASSSVKAAGIWQFMPKTGKYFNLQQNMFVDERRDVLSSTGAALDYLAKLYNMFGDWHLALAAYNWGEGSVSRAIARNQSLGLPTDYLSLRMPNETKYYVPKLQAVKNIIASPEKYGIELKDIPNHPYFVTLTTSRDIDVQIASNLAEMSISEFKAINPSFNKVIIGATKPQILLPWNKAEKFQANLKSYPWPLSTVTAITLNNKESVDNLARRFGIEADAIRRINNIGKGFRFRAGSTVLMPKVGGLQNDISEHIAENGRIATEREAPDMKKVYVTAKRGDTLMSIARRYDVSVRSVLSHGKLRRGQKVALVVPTSKTVKVTEETEVIQKTKSKHIIYKTKIKTIKTEVGSKKVERKKFTTKALRKHKR